MTQGLDLLRAAAHEGDAIDLGQIGGGHRVVGGGPAGLAGPPAGTAAAPASRCALRCAGPDGRRLPAAPAR